jgi:hypothetical protein
VRSRGQRLAALAIGLAAGCGGSGSKFGATDLAVATFLSGNDFAAVVTDGSGQCPLSPGATLAINGQDVAISGCTGVPPTFVGNPPFTLRVTDGGESAEADVDDLAPGTKATLIPDSSIPAGTAFAISIPLELQGQPIGQAAIVNSTDGTSTLASPTSDGQSIQLQAPAQAGSYVVTVSTGDNGTPTPLGHVSSCTGFGRCVATAGSVLGPVSLVVSPASTP